MECLELLHKPWFHAVMGNHEQLMLGCFIPCLYNDLPPDVDSDIGTTFIANGGAWAFNELGRDRRPSPEFARLLHTALKLPQVLIVGEGSERYNIVHADLVKQGWSNHLQQFSVWKDAELDKMAKPYPAKQDFSGFRWSRALMEMWRQDSLIDETIPGLSLTFCGHTVAPMVRTVWSHICLDTGAFLTYRRSKRLMPAKPGLTLADVYGKRALTLRVGAGIEEIPVGRF
jgi:serine/threonine protein phosphatase 1